MKVRWTATARAHLHAIYAYIAQDSPDFATRTVDRLTRKSQQIGKFPFSGRRVPEYDVDQLREIIEGPYRIIYHIKQGQIDVVAVIKNDIEYMLFLRKGTHYRSLTVLQKNPLYAHEEGDPGVAALAWTDIKGESRLRGHPSPFPQALAERLIRLFSFAGDTVLDPFLGTGSTTIAAAATEMTKGGLPV